MVTGKKRSWPGFLADHLARAQRAAALIADIPVVSKAEFHRQTQLCDILLTIPPTAYVSSVFSRCWIQVSALAQACQYCSAKIYLGENIVAGYGFRLRGEKAVFRGIPYRKFLHFLDKAILIRVTGLTSHQQHNIRRFVAGRLGTGFDCGWVLRSFFQRQLRGAAPKRPDREYLHQRGAKGLPLTCATMISLPFYQEGIAFHRDPWLTWPVDFIRSPHTLKLCRIE